MLLTDAVTTRPSARRVCSDTRADCGESCGDRHRRLGVRHGYMGGVTVRLITTFAQPRHGLLDIVCLATNFGSKWSAGVDRCPDYQEGNTF
jgi:hypothetical protein